MPTQNVVPDASKILPQQPVPSTTSGTETNAAVLDRAKLVAAAKLRRKNRRGKQMKIVFPGAVTQLETDVNYTFLGFSPDVDAVTAWTLDDLEIQFRGKSGAQTTAHFHAAMTF
jgi:hypothetical protein